MRIIAGELRGRRLKAVSGQETRPTADKVKGAIFNVLRDKIEGAKVLDLFAGTGNLALEALSRGAREAVLVEKSGQAQKVIEENLRLVTEDRAKLFCMDAFEFLARFKNEVFDLIFLDPPYRQQLVHKAIDALADPCRLSSRGVIVAETARDEILPSRISCFEVRKTGEYGDTKVWYLQRIDE